jgi:hypothetical protein
LLYPCVNLKILYVFLFPGQGLVEHILVDISWVMVGNYVEKKKVMLDEKMGKVAKGERKRERERKMKKEKKRKVFHCVRSS